MSELASSARRGYALASLASAAAALVVAVLALVRHPLELAITVVLVAFALAMAWAALVRRGWRRVVAAAAAVVALGAGAALPDVRAYLVLVLVAALVLLSAATGRLAVANAPAVPGTPVGPARHGVLLLNPRSGGGKATRFALADKARALGVVPVELTPGDDLRELAERAVADGADVLGMAGGDGSQALVADIASRHGVAFVCIPAGTRNHFALDLGLDREDVPAALGAFGDAVERRVDLAEINGRVFVNNASLGVYATVVQSPAYRDAKVATVAQRLPDLLGPDAERPDLRFTGPGGAPQPTADVVLVSNGPYRLDHLSGFGTRERLDSGTLGLVTVTVDRAGDVPALMSAEMAGQLARFRGYRAWTAPEFVVDSARPLVEVGVDGEALRLAPPLEFRIRPGALRVRVPTGASPAAVMPTGTRSVIVTLFQVLRGRAPA